MISAGQVNSTQKYKVLTDQDRRQIEAGICDTDTKCTSAMNVPVDAELAKGDGHGNAITDAISERFHEGLRSITGGLAQSCSQQTEKSGAKRKQRYFECTTSIILKNGEVQLLGEKGSYSAQVEKAGAIARGEIAPPSPDYLELPKSIKDFIAKLPTELPDDLDGQAKFAEAAERIYRQAMAILYPRSEMINAMDPAGKQVLDDAALGLQKQLDAYKGGDKGKLDEIKHTIPYALSGEAPYELKLTLRPAEFGDENELIPAELVRLFKEAMNYFEPKGGTDVNSLAAKLKEAVKGLKDPAAELPGLEVKDVGVSGGGATNVEIGPRSKNGMEVPTVLINKINAQNDPAKQWALDYLFMQALKKVEKKLSQKNKKVTPEVRMAIAEQLAQETQFMDAFTVSLQQVGAPGAVPMLSPVPDALWKPIVNAIQSVRRSSPAIDSYVVSYLIKANDLFQQGKVAKGRPAGMSDDDLAAKLGEEVAAIIADGKGVPYKGEDKNVKIVTNVKYLLGLKFAGFNKDGSLNLISSSGGNDHDIGWRPPSEDGKPKDLKEGLHGSLEFALGGMGSPAIDRTAEAEKDKSPDNVIAEFSGNLSYFWYLDDDDRNSLNPKLGLYGGYYPAWYDAGENYVDITGGDHGDNWQLKAVTLSPELIFRLGDDKQHQIGLDPGLIGMKIPDAAGAGFAPWNMVNSGVRNYVGNSVSLGANLYYNYVKSGRTQAHSSAFEYSSEKSDRPKEVFNGRIGIIGGSATGGLGNEVTKVAGPKFGLGASMALDLTGLGSSSPAIDIIGYAAGGWQGVWGNDENGDPIGGSAYDLSIGLEARFHDHFHLMASFGGGKTTTDKSVPETGKIAGDETRLRFGVTAAFPIEDAMFVDPETGEGIKIVPSIGFGMGFVDKPINPLDPMGNPEAEGCEGDQDCDGILDEEDACANSAGIETEDPATNGCCPDGMDCTNADNPQAPTGESDNIDDRGIQDWRYGGKTYVLGGGVDVLFNANWSLGAWINWQRYETLMGDSKIDALGGGVRGKVTF